MVAAHQFALDLRTPADHADFLGEAPERSKRIIWTPQRDKPHWHTVSQAELREALAAYVDQPDIYITPNEFKGWRIVRNAAALHSFYVDIDTPKGEKPDPARMASQAISRIEAAAIPTPNAIIYTGRGVHLYWLIERTSAAALPRWQSCERELIRILQGDKQVADVTRVLRVIGTINSKNGRKVTAETLHRDRYSFDWLADQILPHTREEIRELREQRATVRDLRARLAETGQPRIVAGSIYQRWYLVYQDLWRIVQHHKWAGGQGVTEGNRDRVLFHMANALSWFTVSDALDSEISSLARKIVPTLKESEAMAYCGSVLRRARLDAEKDEGRRYKYKRATLWAQLGDLVPPELLPKLRAIIPDETKAEREKERQKARNRVAEGRYQLDRQTYLAGAEQRRETALLLRAQGKKWAEIGAVLGVSATAARLLASREKAFKSAPLV